MFSYLIHAREGRCMSVIMAKNINMLKKFILSLPKFVQPIIQSS